MKSKLAATIALAVSITSSALQARADAVYYYYGPGMAEWLLLSGSWMTLTHLLQNRPHYKMAVLDAAPAAAEVLNGAAADDLFRSGREAVEALGKHQFANDREAAIAILELGESLRANESE